jgi:hypothetical protein
MINFIKSSFFTFTIWIVTAMLNSLLYAVIFSLGNLVKDGFIETAGIVFFFSLLMSVSANCQHEQLSRILLRTVFILTLFTVMVITLVPGGTQKGHWLLQSSIIVVSAIISVMLHHRFLKSFFHSQLSSHV